MSSQLERRQALRLELLSGLIDDRAHTEGKSLRQVARELAISPGTFSRMRDGRAPDAYGVVAILTWLDLPASVLLHDEDAIGSSVQDRVQAASAARRAEIERAKAAASAAPVRSGQPES